MFFDFKIVSIAYRYLSSLFLTSQLCSDAAFDKTVSELLLKRIICVWKPRKGPKPNPGDLLWSSRYLINNWIDINLPLTKFESNMKFLGEQPPLYIRNFFYRVENVKTVRESNEPVQNQEPVHRQLT